MDREELIQLIRQVIQEEFSDLLAIDRYTFQKHLQVFDGKNIQLGQTTGTKIGTATTQKLAFYGVAPVDQPDTIADPSGGVTQDAAARGAINTIIDRLQELGLIA